MVVQGLLVKRALGGDEGAGILDHGVGDAAATQERRWNVALRTGDGVNADAGRANMYDRV